MLTHKQRYITLISISIVAVIAMLFVGPIAQDPSYHLFADTRQIFGVSHFWNVASNIPFLLVAALGLFR